MPAQNPPITAPAEREIVNSRVLAASREKIFAAFADPAVLDRGLRLPEISPHPVPGRTAIGFHLVDYVAHGWDVAHTLGLAYDLPPDVLAAALPVAEGVPDAARVGPEAAFGPRLRNPGEDPLARILALLGRDAGTNVVPPR